MFLKFTWTKLNFKPLNSVISYSYDKQHRTSDEKTYLGGHDEVQADQYCGCPRWGRAYIDRTPWPSHTPALSSFMSPRACPLLTHTFHSFTRRRRHPRVCAHLNLVGCPKLDCLLFPEKINYCSQSQCRFKYHAS